MNTNDPTVAIEVDCISKYFRLYPSINDRIREILHPFNKTYHTEHWVLKDISFWVNKGETVGILGRNGTGKSTLLALIAGILQPYNGKVITYGRIATLLELGAGFRAELSGRDNTILHGILHGLTHAEIKKNMPEIESFADVGEYFDQPVRTYSSGMFLRVAFSAAIHADPDILVVDEALSVGDSYFQAKCLGRFRELQEQKKTILFVSHDRQQISRVCDRVIVLSGSEIIFDGPTQQGINVYESMLHGHTIEPAKASTLTIYDRSALECILDKDEKTIRLPEHPGFNPDYFHFSDGRARLLDTLFLCNDIQNPLSIPSGSHIDIYIKYQIMHNIDRPSYGVSITSNDGSIIHGTNTDMKNLALPPATENSVQVVRFSFEASISPGIYAINIGLTDITLGTDGFVDTCRSILRFEIEGRENFSGTCDLQSEFYIL